MIRPAALADVRALVQLENRCFDSDRLSARSFRYMLTKAKAATLVADEAGAIVGYVLVLFHAGTSLARLYSIAVDPGQRGQGLGRRLLEAAEDAAREHECAYMRLEVRTDNPAARQLYESLRYKPFAVVADYYEDHQDAVRFEKRLVASKPDLGGVPYYQQTLDFTCGAATLLMAMKALNPEEPMDRQQELRIWREATTVFMTAGHGGCGPFGLALSAYKRGFDVEIHVNDDGVLFVDSVRSEEKKEVMRLVQEDFLDEVRSLPIPVIYGQLRVDELREKFAAGGIPVVLISSYRIYKEKFPHWVVVTGFDEHFVYVHDPYVDHEQGKSEMDCINLPIPQQDFARMARYGKSGLRAVLIIRPRSA